LPIESFCPFGANVKTNVLFARKLRPKEKQNKDAKVCLIKVESVGYDASGRQTQGSDLPQALARARAFLKNYGW